MLKLLFCITFFPSIFLGTRKEINWKVQEENQLKTKRKFAQANIPLLKRISLRSSEFEEAERVLTTKISLERK